MSRAAFRRLQRLCRQFDREPSLQLGLVGRPPRLYDWHFNRVWDSLDRQHLAIYDIYG